MAITFFLKYFLKNGSVRLSRIKRETFLAGPHNFSIKNLGEVRISVKILLFFSARIREKLRYRANNLLVLT